MSNEFRALSAAFFLSCLPAAAIAQQTSFAPIVVDGHHVMERDENGSRELLLDGRLIDSGANRYSTEFRTTLGGQEVAAVYADTGGASCMDGSIIVVGAGIVGDQMPRVANQGCFAVPSYGRIADANGERLVIELPAAINAHGELWGYSPGQGLRREAVLEFQPQPGTTFADLRHKAESAAPYSFFDNDAFTKQFDAVVGAARENVLKAVGDAEPGAPVDGRYLISTGFQQHDAQHQTLVGLDLDTKAAFVADYPGQGKIAVYPDVKTWPKPLRKRLAAWAKGVAAQEN